MSQVMKKKFYIAKITKEPFHNTKFKMSNALVAKSIDFTSKISPKWEL